MRLRSGAAIAIGGVATASCLVWMATAGIAVASASTRLRSGAVREQLVSHVNTVGSTAQSGIVPNGANAMFAVVALMALLAFVFLVVTFIRRRVSA